jgi:hypothetical protein
MKDYHRLSTSDRAASDAAYRKADEIGKKIDELRVKQS